MLHFEKKNSQVLQMICRLCVQWWDKGLRNKEKLILNCLIYLLNEIVFPDVSTKVIFLCNLMQLHVHNFVS